MSSVYDEMLQARQLATRAVTLAMLGASTEEALASLSDVSAMSNRSLSQARTLLEVGTDDDSFARREARRLLDATISPARPKLLVAA